MFGSLVHVKTLGVNLKKLDDNVKLMIFIGYKKGTKGYKTYDLILEIFMSLEMLHLKKIVGGIKMNPILRKA